MMSPTFPDTQHSLLPMLAGVPGFEPGLSVLETDVLTVDTIPLQTLPIANLRLVITADETQIGNQQLAIGNVYLVSL
jgi:hypothetical protein